MRDNDEWLVANIDQIGKRAESYSFSAPSDDEFQILEDSVQRFGVMRPLVCLAETGELVLVSGYKRLIILEEAGVQNIPLRILPRMDVYRLWDFLLEEHLGSRAMNPVELGRYCLLRENASGESQDQISKNVLPRLGLSPKASILDDAKWIAALPCRLKQPFADGRLPLQGVRVLKTAPREDALAVLALLLGAKAGVNKFVEIIRWIFECAWRENLTAGQLIEKEKLENLCMDSEALRSRLKILRYPRLSDLEAAFAVDIRAVKLPKNVNLSHPKGFEGGRLTCTASFSDLNKLEQILFAMLEGLKDGRFRNLSKYLADGSPDALSDDLSSCRPASTPSLRKSASR